MERISIGWLRVSVPRSITALAIGIFLAALAAGCGSGGKSLETGGSSGEQRCATGLSQAGSGVCLDKKDPRGKRVATLIARLRRKHNLYASIFEVWSGRKPIASGAFGSALPGVRASVADHFRISDVTETFTSTVLLMLVDQGKLSLDDPVSKWLPWLPHAKQVTLGMLASSTSGYADYVTNPTFVKALRQNPFRLWPVREIIRLGVSRPSLFPPGKSWAFSDTNFMILGDILTRVGGEPLGEQIRKQILDRLGLDNTAMQYTADVPSPVLHGYDPERGDYQDATNWSPSWAQYTASMTSNLADMGRWAQALGTGKLLSAASHRKQVGPGNVGLGPLTKQFYYGLGVGVASKWIFSNPHLPGYSGFLGYYPPKKLTVAIWATPAMGNPDQINDSQAIFAQVAQILTPNSAPKLAQRVGG
jgi:CubicO group peptidase (beta-lactamase class C family)